MGRGRDDEGSESSREGFGRPLADSMKRIRRQLVTARKKSKAPLAPRNPAPKVEPTPASDADAFREATAGASALETKPRRISAAAHVVARTFGARNDVRFDPTADEHFDIRFSDLFIRGRAAGVSRETITKLERGEFAVRSHVDLHGLAFDDAKDVVDRFLSDRQKRGDRCVLVITGKGRNSPRQIAVLRERIPEWLARGPSARRVLAFVTARPCDGGEGALYVLLRRHTSRKGRIDVEAGGGV